MKRNSEPAGIILLMAAAIVAHAVYDMARSSDLMATWIAGQMFAAERLSEIYVTSEHLFTMNPPDSWQNFMAQTHGYHDALFPYLYPPLWAWLFSFTGNLSFDAIERVATVLNAGLISGCVYLGYRITRAPLSLPVFACLTLPILYVTPIGALAMYENQPQILVCFLLLLTLERLRGQDETTAGLVLAIAAAIKIYPALFALLFLAKGNRRGFIWFAVGGTALGGLSILVAGWPLHVDFLTSAKTAAQTTLVSVINFNIHVSIAQLLWPDHLTEITLTGGTPINGRSVTWQIMEKGAAWRLVSTLTLLGAVAGLFVMMRKASEVHRFEALWPAAFLAVPLLGPIGWSYYYIAPIVLMPALFRSLPFLMAFSVHILLFALLCFPAQPIFNAQSASVSIYQIVATTAIALLALLFVFTHLRKAVR